MCACHRVARIHVVHVLDNPVWHALSRAGRRPTVAEGDGRRRPVPARRARPSRPCPTIPSPADWDDLARPGRRRRRRRALPAGGADAPGDVERGVPGDGAPDGGDGGGRSRAVRRGRRARPTTTSTTCSPRRHRRARAVLGPHHRARHLPRRARRVDRRARRDGRRAGAGAGVDRARPRCRPIPPPAARASPAGSSRDLVGRIRSRGDEACLHVVETNVIAIRLYEALGFEVRSAFGGLGVSPPG